MCYLFCTLQNLHGQPAKAKQDGPALRTFISADVGAEDFEGCINCRVQNDLVRQHGGAHLFLFAGQSTKMARFHHPAMGGSLKFKGDDPNKKKKRCASFPISSIVKLLSERACRKKSKLSEDVAAVAVKDDAEAGSSQAVVTKTKKAKKEEQEAARNALAQAYDQLPESGKTEAEKRFEKEQLKRVGLDSFLKSSLRRQTGAAGKTR